MINIIAIPLALYAWWQAIGRTEEIIVECFSTPWFFAFVLGAFYFRCAIYTLTHLVDEKEERGGVELFAFYVCAYGYPVGLFFLFLFSFVEENIGKGVLMMIIGFPASAAFLSMLLVGVPVYVWTAIVAFVPSVTFLIYAATTTDALVVTKKTTDERRPSVLVERDLAKALRAGVVSDREIADLVRELPALTRWFQMVRYKSMAKKYRKARELLDIQHEVMKEEIGIAEEVHQFERTKRARNDR